MSASEISQHTGISHPGTLKALVRLEKTGFLQSTGSERSKLYSFTSGNALTDALRVVFRTEGDWHKEMIDDLRDVFSSVANPVDSGWLCLDEYKLGDALEIGFLTNSRHVARTKAELRDRLVSFEQHHKTPTRLIGLSRADLHDYERNDIVLLVGYSPFEESVTAFRPRSHFDLDLRSHKIAEQLAQLIERDPTIVTRAREYVERVIREGPQSTRTDLMEWRRILQSYSQRQLLDFLVDTGERATRLRQSTPFLPVLTPSERVRIRSALESHDD